MLEAALATQLKGLLTNVTMPVELVSTLDDGAKSAELAELLDEIAGMSEHIQHDRTGDDPRTPSFLIRRAGTDIAVQFAGIPLGHEFSSLVLALLQVGGHPSKEAADLLEQVRDLEGDYHFETYFSLSCQNCPDVVQALNLMAVLNARITHTAIDGSLFQDEVDNRQVMAVPTVFVNGELFDSGRMNLEQIVGKLDSGAAERTAASLSEKERFDVLVVGGGPSGATASVYAARKGIRTGIVAERFGGQVLDTMAIENFTSVSYTEGPKFAAELESQVRQYDVDIMNSQRGAKLARDEETGVITVDLASGARLQSRTVVVSTGARWRSMDVPGETEYRNKGVTYCPHCDGPLFKGKRVAVIGGGNSGVEAAIDLAGIVSHVTLIEFDSELRADQVLQRKLRSLPNVDVLVSAMTTEVVGDGRKVTGLNYTSRTTDEAHALELDGVFVQIGLLPNTEWLEGTLELSPRGEIVVDEAGRTSLPGVFAAGDCTTVPFKQIVVAAGSGATAALSAFDHLIRTDVPVEATTVG
ncbi:MULTISPECIES: alkyl hydroperoxide reductase subunit F [Tsukamurella]|uniref:Alkyl hydroperoxide reductase subunit F n=2 Tax=Tsukamurella TaxID=2060 RepID=A0A5C5S2H8_9ACTN|nr:MULTISPECIES: alkyl hydroperoxide reductase subunit F [Tsukamurella]NMD54581.1 alkyl hydroperoxide reductase subunit F [Tsukamurella columbiensis]TWS28501.1 alkyl hydroperoxide reductase subunit F [Tsukamurella conjunctivitidis]